MRLEVRIQIKISMYNNIHEIHFFFVTGDPNPFISIPILAQELMHMKQLNWNHKTIPQKYSMQGMNDKVSLWPRGKVLGNLYQLVTRV